MISGTRGDRDGCGGARARGERGAHHRDSLLDRDIVTIHAVPGDKRIYGYGEALAREGQVCQSCQGRRVRISSGSLVTPGEESRTRLRAPVFLHSCTTLINSILKPRISMVLPVSFSIK